MEGVGLQPSLQPGGVRHEIRPIRMRFLQSDCRAWKEPFSELYIINGEILALFQACVGNFDITPPWKVVGTLYLDSSCINFKYFAFLSVCDKFELLGHVQAAMDDLSVIFAVLSWIHCRLLWLLLAVFSDYFGQLVTSTLLLYRFRGLPGFTPVSFLVMRR